MPFNELIESIFWSNNLYW